MKLVCGCE